MIDAFLPANEPMRQAVLIELVHIDLERRLKRGEAVRVENYLARYPALASNAAATVELLAEEYIFRSRENPNLQPSELFERFPHCAEQLRIELSGKSEFGIVGQSADSIKPPVLEGARPGGSAKPESSPATDVKPL